MQRVAEARRVSHRWGLLFAVIVALLVSFGADRVSAHGPGDEPSVALVPVVSGLSQPTAVEIATDGRIFILEKDGRVKVAQGEGQPATTILDLSTQVHSLLDRGLLGLALHPDFPANPAVFVSYTYDAPIGGTAPTYGNGLCPDPDVEACPATGEILKLNVNASNEVTDQQVLVHGAWCFQFPTHSLDDLVFGPDGALYVSAGDGGNPLNPDYGQIGSNPCGDPAFEGGALRSQDLRTNFNPTGDPVTWSGAIVRLDPETGSAMPDNPLVGGSAADDAIVAYGLRNPYRIAFRPDTDELWIGDVGWGYAEEINVHDDPTEEVKNFGWPCYEGPWQQGVYAGLGIPICSALYSQSSLVDAPFYSYFRNQQPGGAECQALDSAVSAMAFIDGSPYPEELDGALLFADYGVGCVWLMEPDDEGEPDPDHIQLLATGRYTADITRAPTGELYLVDIGFGTVNRIDIDDSNAGPTAVLTVSATSGPAPLAVDLDASASLGNGLSFSWDLDDDGGFDDAQGPLVTHIFNRGTHNPKVRVTDGSGFMDTATVVINVDNGPPEVTMVSPAPGDMFRAGEVISLEAMAVDPDGTVLDEASFEWTLLLHHCEGSDCHQHYEGSLTGSSHSVQGSAHPYPSYLEAVLRVSDGEGGLTTVSRDIQPIPATLTVLTEPAGLELLVTPDTVVTPASSQVIAGSDLNVSAPARQDHLGQTYGFVAWSNGGTRTQEVVVSDDMTLTAFYAPDLTEVSVSPSSLVFPDAFVGQTIAETVTIEATGPTGSVPAVVESATIGGPGLSLAYVPETVDVGESDDLIIEFTPTVSGTVTGQVSLLINGVNYDIAVSATGALAPPAELEVPANAGDLGRVIEGNVVSREIPLKAIGGPFDRPVRILGATSSDDRVRVLEVPSLVNVGETVPVVVEIVGESMGEITATVSMTVGFSTVEIPVRAMVTDSRDSGALFDPATGQWRVVDAFGQQRYFYYGNPGDTPLLGDWDCDGYDTPGMFRPSNGFVYLTNRAGNGVSEFEFFYGQGGDVPVVGDWNGDGCDTLAIYRSGEVFVRNTLGTGVADDSFFFGDNGDRPFSGDFDGDGVSSIGLYRTTTGFVYFRNELSSGFADNTFFYGIPSDEIFAGDFDADIVETVGIYRPSDGRFYLSNENTQRPADETLDTGHNGWLATAGLLPI